MCGCGVVSCAEYDTLLAALSLCLCVSDLNRTVEEYLEDDERGFETMARRKWIIWKEGAKNFRAMSAFSVRNPMLASIHLNHSDNADLTTTAKGRRCPPVRPRGRRHWDLARFTKGVFCRARVTSRAPSMNSSAIFSRYSALLCSSPLGSMVNKISPTVFYSKEGESGDRPHACCFLNSRALNSYPMRSSSFLFW